jgi:futalosine hydrolase
MKPTIVAAHSLELPGISDGIPVGIGLVEASLGIAALLEKAPPAVVLVGSCGAYPGSGLDIGTIVVAREAVLIADGELPSVVPTRSRPPAFAMEGRRVVVASTMGITTDDARAKSIADATDAHVENLEAFAVARACERANVPVAIVLGVTNVVGSQGRAEWRANAQRIALDVIAHVRKS